MASAQVDHLNMPNIISDLSGSASSEHVASGSFAPDANALREAALKSRRKKQAIAREQLAIASNPPATVINSQPLVDEDTPMNDASSLVDIPTTDISKSREEPVDTEDGEIPESSTGDKPDTPEREKTPRPPSTADTLSTPSSSAAELPKYVRPGLNMTARDLDEAKHLILDLLGLGVTPEYLVDCGVSPQCLAICFYELNLRFPLNLDRRQINLPSFYDLDKHMKDSQRREQIIRQRDRGRLRPKPILPVVTTEGSESSRVDRSASPGRNGSEETPVSTEPSPPTHIDVNIGRGATTEITGPHLTEVVQPSSPKEVDISLIEDQKRMELLARKAAMDSITKKRAAKNSGPAFSSPEQSVPQLHHMEIKDVESAVDALLASVRMNSDPSNESEDRSSKECEVGSTNSGERLPDYDSDAMVENELETQSPSCSDSDIDELMDSEPNATPEPTPALLSSPKPYLSRVQFDTPDPVRSSSLPTQPTPIAVPVVARRSRPIASDFIDQTPPRPASASKSGTERTALLKRKRSFVDPAIWPKRLVIDLDSSDEEDDQDEGVSSGAAGSSGSSTKDRAPSRTSSRDKPTTNGQDQAAQMLLEKELQIKAMMQKIKMRELQKKKSASGSRTPMPAPGTPAEPSKTAILNADPTSSPIASTVNLTPVATPSSEIPPTIPAAEQEVTPIPVAKENHSILNNSLGIVSPNIDKGKGKALEPEGIRQDDLIVTSTVVHSNNDTQLEPSLNLDSEQTPTHFKAYVSPLAGFTSPNLQRARPTDQQLSAILWISSSAGQSMDRQLCMYEFPSGICKNQGCKDIHARDFGASDDDIRRTARTMFPNVRPESLTEIIARVRQSIQAS